MHWEEKRFCWLWGCAASFDQGSLHGNRGRASKECKQISRGVPPGEFYRLSQWKMVPQRWHNRKPKVRLPQHVAWVVWHNKGSDVIRGQEHVQNHREWEWRGAALWGMCKPQLLWMCGVLGRAIGRSRSHGSTNLIMGTLPLWSLNGKRRSKRQMSLLRWKTYFYICLCLCQTLGSN